MKMYLKPLYDRVIVLPDEAPTVSPGGIALLPTSTLSDGALRGKVVAAGESVEVQVKVGDFVYYPPFSGFRFEACDNKYLVLKANEILLAESYDETDLTNK